MNIFYLFLMGISLSLDAFSLAISVGSFEISSQKNFILSLIVGLFHFIMPILGAFLGTKIKYINLIDSNTILGLILLAIGLDLLYHYFKEEEININLNLMGMLLFAFGVSLDAFSLGIGLIIDNYDIILSGIIFSICSFSFTYLGLLIGKYGAIILGKYSKIIGFILLFYLSIIHLLK